MKKKRKDVVTVFKQGKRYILVYRTPEGKQIAVESDFVGK